MSSYARAIIELQDDVKLKDTIVVAMPKLVDGCPNVIVSGVEKNLKNHRQAARGVQIGPNVAFTPIKQVYRPVSNRNNASSSGKKKNDVIASKESLPKVISMEIVDGNSDVEDMVDDHARKTKRDDDYHPYDDDLYESHDMFKAICDELDITVHDEPSVGLIYLNSKEEKRIIDLVDISKFCDATLEKVLKEVKLKVLRPSSR
ncbi:hypothetical protein Tco_0666796, partial [Tanacetum coccineum]